MPPADRLRPSCRHRPGFVLSATPFSLAANGAGRSLDGWPCRWAARMDSLRFLSKLAVLGGIALAVSGCAAGAWLESPSEGELPLDTPSRGYPTAIRGPASNVPPSQSSSTTQAITVPSAASAVNASASMQPGANVLPSVPAQQSAPVQSEARQQRLDRQPTLTPLAVIPSQFVHQPVNPTQPPLATMSLPTLPSETSLPLPSLASQ